MRSIIVTGGSRGIGSAISATLAKAGYAIVINYNNSAEKAFELCKEIQEQGGKAIAIQGDVSKTADIKKIFEQAYKNFGTPYALINNAGIALQNSLIQDISDKQLEAVISTNLIGAIKCSREATRYMVSEHCGRIINISSIWGEVGASCEVVYSASKAGIIGLTKALAKELAPSGITVNCIAPGVINTDMISCYTQEDIELLRNETPLGRIGTPNDIASAVEFLISDKSSFITAQVLGVNGGFGI